MVLGVGLERLKRGRQQWHKMDWALEGRSLGSSFGSDGTTVFACSSATFVTGDGYTGNNGIYLK